MSLERILAENMLRFGVKNLNEKELIFINVKSGHNIYSDYTYINERGELLESRDLKLLIEKPDDPKPGDPEFADADSSYMSRQSKFRKFASKVRRSVKNTPFMVKWANWRTKKWVKKNGLPARNVLESRDSDQLKNTPGYKEVIDLLYDKRTRDEGSILYWYGIEVLGGEADPAAAGQMTNIIDSMKKLNGKIVQSTDPDAQPITLNLSTFAEKLEELQKQKIYITGEDLISIFSSDASPALNHLFTIIATGKDAEGTGTYNISAESVINDIAEDYNNSFDDGYRADAFYDEMAVDLKRLQNFSTKLTLGAAGEEGTQGGKATYAVSMTEADKLAMIPRIMEQHRLNLQENPDLTWQDYTTFVIAPGTAEIKVNLLKIDKGSTAKDEQEAYASYYSYPEDPNDPASMNKIYGNFDDETTWSDTSDFEAEMQRRIDAIVKSGGEIYRIEYNAGARSSAVGTFYGGLPDNASNAQKTEANIKLCTDRATGITTAMKPIIDKLLPGLPDGAKELKKPNLHPNRGPGWYEYNPQGTADNAGKTYGTGYGPLYNKWYTTLAKSYKSLKVPRAFYAARNKDGQSYYDRLKQTWNDVGPEIQKKLGPLPTQEEINKEYESIFGPHRGTYAGYVLFYTTKPNTEAPPTEDMDAKIQTSGQWFFTLDYAVFTWGDFSNVVKSRWKRFKRKIKKFKLPKLQLSAGGGVVENLVHICDAYN